ncbi:MAG TPA: DUF6134 family protein [Alphaproteobacteria bacterium]
MQLPLYDVTMACPLWRILLVLAILVPIGGAARADPVPAAINFVVKRDGTSIGTHRLSFRSEQTVDGERLFVDIAIEIKVVVAFITIYTYKFEGREVWDGERLVVLETYTNDNGTKLDVHVRAAADGLHVDATDVHYVAAPDMLPDSYWRTDTVKHTRFIDIENGQLTTLVSEPAGRRAVNVAGRMAETDIYKLSGEIEGELGYTPAGEWTLLRFKSHGSNILYVREAP